MDHSQAKLLLKIHSQDPIDSETINDAVAEVVFIETTFFLRRNFIPKLAKKRIANLELIIEASKTLGFDYAEPELVRLSIEDSAKHKQLKEILSAYHQRESEIKLKLSTCENPIAAIGHYHNWITEFTAFANRFIYLFDKLQLQDLAEISGVRMTDSLEFNLLFSELDSGNYKNLVWREYNRLKLLMA